MNIRELKRLIKDLDDDMVVQIQIESGMSCYSLSDDVSGQEQDEDEDTGESSFLLFGEETSFE